jgi:hypothetical protein
MYSSRQPHDPIGVNRQVVERPLKLIGLILNFRCTTSAPWRWRSRPWHLSSAINDRCATTGEAANAAFYVQFFIVSQDDSGERQPEDRLASFASTVMPREHQYRPCFSSA